MTNFCVGRDKVPAKQGIEGTVNDVMNKCIVPSIRHTLSQIVLDTADWKRAKVTID